LAGPELPELFQEAFSAPAGPVAPVLPDSVLPLVLASPDSAADPEFDVVFTEPDLPPLPELPEVATGLEVALPVSVEPVEPVLPDVAVWFPGADGWWCFFPPWPQLSPPQLFPPWYTGVAYWAPPGEAYSVPPGFWIPCPKDGNWKTPASPEFPEFPEFPELPDVAEPLAVAGPVLPESALPELAEVSLELDELASPEVPPLVLPVAVLLPLLPEVAVAVDLSMAFPVEPDVAFPIMPEGPFGKVGCDPPSGVACAELAAKSRTPAASPPVHRVLVNLPMRGDSFRSLDVPIWHRIGAALTRIRNGWLTLRGRRSSSWTGRRDDNPSPRPVDTD
jgi:hypothetical protein